jgi:methylisocitrate lyase
VEAPQTVDEIRRGGPEVKAPLLANMVQGGKTAALCHRRARALGFRIAIFPAVCMAAAVPAIERALGLPQGARHRLARGAGALPDGHLQKVGFDWWHAVEEKYTGA